MAINPPSKHTQPIIEKIMSAKSCKETFFQNVGNKLPVTAVRAYSFGEMVFEISKGTYEVNRKNFITLGVPPFEIRLDQDHPDYERMMQVFEKITNKIDTDENQIAELIQIKATFSRQLGKAVLEYAGR